MPEFSTNYSLLNLPKIDIPGQVQKYQQGQVELGKGQFELEAARKKTAEQKAIEKATQDNLLTLPDGTKELNVAGASEALVKSRLGHLVPALTQAHAEMKAAQQKRQWDMIQNGAQWIGGVPTDVPEDQMRAVYKAQRDRLLQLYPEMGKYVPDADKVTRQDILGLQHMAKSAAERVAEIQNRSKQSPRQEFIEKVVASAAAEGRVIPRPILQAIEASAGYPTPTDKTTLPATAPATPADVEIGAMLDEAVSATPASANAAVTAAPAPAPAPGLQPDGGIIIPGGRAARAIEALAVQERMTRFRQEMLNKRYAAKREQAEQEFVRDQRRKTTEFNAKMQLQFGPEAVAQRAAAKFAGDRGFVWDDATGEYVLSAPGRQALKKEVAIKVLGEGLDIREPDALDSFVDSINPRTPAGPGPSAPALSAPPGVAPLPQGTAPAQPSVPAVPSSPAAPATSTPAPSLVPPAPPRGSRDPDAWEGIGINDSIRSAIPVVRGAPALPSLPGTPAAKRARDVKASDVAEFRGLVGLVARLRNTAHLAEEISMMPGLSTATGPVMGRLPAGLVGVFSEKASDAMALLDQFKARVFRAAVDDMRNASKTGATGLGQITAPEIKRLEEFEANIARAQSTPQLVRQLTKLSRHLGKTVLPQLIGGYDRMYGTGTALKDLASVGVRVTSRSAVKAAADKLNRSFRDTEDDLRNKGYWILSE